jgi:adenylate cyclase
VARVARVEIVHGCPPRVVEVPSSGLEMGRGDSVGLLLDAPSVSKRHARFFWEGDDLLVEDLGSTNKVHRDGLMLDQKTSLGDGDELVLGEVVLRVSIIGQSTLVPVAQLPDTANAMSPRPKETGPTDVERRAAEILPVVEQFFHARDFRDLGRKIVTAVKVALKVSRAALIELEDDGQRLRVLAVDGAKDITFVSRTIVAEAVKRGLSLHQLGAVGRPVAVSLVDASAASAVAAMVRTGGDRVRVLYADVLAEHLATSPLLTWRHAFELQLFAASAASAFEALQAQQKNNKDRLRFENLRRNFSPSLVEQLALISRPDEEFLAPAIMPATVVFADLSGLTRLTERWRARPQALVSLLDLWFEQASRAIFAQSGTLDKFIGDGVMAVFGAPFPLDGASTRALRCVTELQRAVAQLARDTSEGLSLTASLCSGPVLSCYTGSRRRHEFTVLGETVGRAARLREQAGPGEILLDEGSAAELSAAAEFDLVGPAPGPPGATMINTWRLRGLKGF